LGNEIVKIRGHRDAPSKTGRARGGAKAASGRDAEASSIFAGTAGVDRSGARRFHQL
jgi:hypothetical protein